MPHYYRNASGSMKHAPHKCNTSINKYISNVFPSCVDATRWTKAVHSERGVIPSKTSKCVLCARTGVTKCTLKNDTFRSFCFGKYRGRLFLHRSLRLGLTVSSLLFVATARCRGTPAEIRDEFCTADHYLLRIQGIRHKSQVPTEYGRGEGRVSETHASRLFVQSRGKSNKLH